MDDASDAVQDENKKKDKEESGSNKFVVIGIISVAVIINAVIALLLINATKPESTEEKIERIKNDSLKQVMEQATTMGATTADPIEAIVNIAGTEGERFLKAEVIFEYNDKEFPNLGEELVRRTPKIKDLLINHLSRLTLEDLTEPDAKDNIRKDLVRLINATIPPKVGEVREVLFTTYIIQ